MSGVGYFFWLAGQALEFPVLFPPAGVMMVAGGVGATAAALRVPAGRGRQALAAVLLPLALPVAILWCGVLWAHDTALDTAAPRWPEWLIGGLLAAHLPLAAALLALLRGARWLALCACIAAFGYSCGAAFMSTMSVTGRWL